MAYRVICALGDSITNGYWDEEGLGWFGRLSQSIAMTYPYQCGFLNLAHDGDVSIDVLHRLETEIPTRRVNVMIIAVGINDLMRGGAADAVLTIDEKTRLEIWDRILVLAKSHADQILVTSILPVQPEKMPFCYISSEGANWELHLSNSDIEEYNAVIKALCYKHNVQFFNLNMPNSYGDWLYDGLHPNAKGHVLIAEQVFDALKAFRILL